MRSRIRKWLYGSLAVAGVVPIAALAQAPARDRPAAPSFGTASGTASVRGRVVDAPSGRPLSRVDVRVGPDRGQVEGSHTVTDADGRYVVGDLPAGTYIITANKVNYLRSAWGAKRDLGPGRSVTLAAGQAVDSVDLVLRRAGAIVGQVVDEFGEAAVNVQVVPLQYRYSQNGRRLLPVGRPVMSNDVGAFRLYGLAPGQYFVSATPLRDDSGFTSQNPSAYAPTFYPGASIVSEAQRVAIGPGETVPGINFTLRPIMTSRVGGTVTDSTGAAVTRGSVSAIEPRGLIPGGLFAPIGADGKFVLSGVAPGDYVLHAFAGDNESVAAAITVTGSDIADLHLATAKPSKVSGRVTFERGGTPPAASGLRVMALQPDPAASGASAAVNGDFTFEMRLAAGRVFLRAAPTRDWRLSRVIVDGVDVTDTGIDVPVNGSLSNVNVELTSHLNPLVGHIKDATGAAVADCFVVLFARDPAHWTPASRYSVNFHPGVEGRFSVKMPPGDYYAVAMAEVEPGASSDPEFLAIIREDAVPFSIRDGVESTLDLTLSPSRVF